MRLDCDRMAKVRLDCVLELSGYPLPPWAVSIERRTNRPNRSSFIHQTVPGCDFYSGWYRLHLRSSSAS